MKFNVNIVNTDPSFQVSNFTLFFPCCLFLAPCPDIKDIAGYDSPGTE